MRKRARFLLLAIAVSAPCAWADPVTVGGAAGAGLFFTDGANSQRGAAPLVSGGIFISRGQGETEPQVAPLYYVGSVQGQLAVGRDASGNVVVPMVDATASVAGVRMHALDTRLSAAFLNVEVSRDTGVDEALAIRTTAVDGMARKMLPFWRRDGVHDLYMQLTLGALGYKHVDAVTGEDHLNGFEIAKVGGELGAAVYAGEKSSFRLAVGGDAELALMVEHGPVQSDLDAYVRAEAVVSNVAQIYAKGALKGNVDPADGGALKSAAEATAGVQLAF